MLSVCPTTIRIPSLTKWTAGVFFTSCYMVDLCGFFTALSSTPRHGYYPAMPPSRTYVHNRIVTAAMLLAAVAAAATAAASAPFTAALIYLLFRWPSP